MSRKLIVEVAADLSALEKGLRKAGKDVSRFNTAITKSGKQTSRAFAGIGKSIALATGGLIAFGGATKFLRDSIAEAEEAGVANRALAAQMKAAGESFQANRTQIEKLSRSYMKFGFEDDEVIASLTVLERGTGNLSQAMKLQQLTADLARAKNLDLAKAATVVAKVFGGQETALRRVVPGLEKNAHGLDLIRQAQAKLAGQAAAATTPSERFHAVLKDTQQVIGDALLPTINKYLTQLSNWMTRMQESGQLQKNVTAAVNLLKDAISALEAIVGGIKTAFDGLNRITGSTGDSLKLLFRVFIGFKALQFASQLKTIATNINLIGVNAGKAAPKVAALSGAGGGGSAGGGKGKGGRFGGLGGGLLLAGGELLARFGGLGTSQNQVTGKAAEDFLRANGLLPPKGATGGKSVWDRARAALKKTPSPLGPTPADVATVKRTVEQRNAFFDAMIGRKVDRVQDAPLRAQLAKLKTIAALITQRLAVTNDITRRLNLEDQLLDIQRRQKDVRNQLTQQTVEKQQQLAALLNQQKEAQQRQREALKAAAEQRAATRMDWLQFALEKAQATKTLADDVKALKRIIAFIKEQIRLTGRTVELARELWLTEQKLRDVNKQRKKSRRSTGPRPAVGWDFDPISGQMVATSMFGRQAAPRAATTRRTPASGFGIGAAPVTIGVVNLYGVQDVAGFEHQLQKRAQARPQTRRGPV